MSTEPGSSRPAAMYRRLLAVATGAGDYADETATNADGRGDAGGGSGSVSAPGPERPEDRSGGVRRGGPRDAGRPFRRAASEIMTPEERVVRLLGRSGGRMRQAELVDVVEWSASTVSRKLSAFEDDGAITRYRIGRENLVFLPGGEPDGFGSPWQGADSDASRA